MTGGNDARTATGAIENDPGQSRPAPDQGRARPRRSPTGHHRPSTVGTGVSDRDPTPGRIFQRKFREFFRRGSQRNARRATLPMEGRGSGAVAVARQTPRWPCRAARCVHAESGDLNERRTTEESSMTRRDGSAIICPLPSGLTEENPETQCPCNVARPAAPCASGRGGPGIAPNRRAGRCTKPSRRRSTYPPAAHSNSAASLAAHINQVLICDFESRSGRWFQRLECNRLPALRGVCKQTVN
jgi:hypothetical protein